eukprot:Gb_38693 [translate_table: standard]
MSLFIRRMKSEFWNPVLDRYSKKLTSWRGNLLSQAGKLQLVQATLQSIPIYFMSVFKTPASVRMKLEKIHKSFLWLGAEVKIRFHLTSWE